MNLSGVFNGIIANDIPKLYICSSWGVSNKEELIEFNKWVNRQIEINSLSMKPRPLEYDDEKANEMPTIFENLRNDIIYPYAEKMGNCEVVCLAGDHMIYEQKPTECGKTVKDFLDNLENLKE